MAVNRLTSAAYLVVALPLVVVLLELQTGCEREGRGPTSPSQTVTPPQAPPPPAPESLEFSLSGGVFDIIGTPLANVRVEVTEGPGLGTVATTNASGNYALDGVFSDTVTVRASKAGYATGTQTFPSSRPAPSGHFTLNFILDTPSLNLAGDYTLTMTTDPACADFPAEARNRTYDATLNPSSSVPNTYVVTLSGATFLPFMNKMFARVAGETAIFDSDPYADAIVIEALTPSSTLTFWGSSRAIVSGRQISAPFDGTVTYCPNVLGPQNTFPYVRCAVPAVDCFSANHVLTLTHANR